MLLWLALSTWLPGSTPTVVISMVELSTAFSLGLGLVEEMVVEQPLLQKLDLERIILP